MLKVGCGSGKMINWLSSFTQWPRKQKSKQNEALVQWAAKQVVKHAAKHCFKLWLNRRLKRTLNGKERKVM